MPVSAIVLLIILVSLVIPTVGFIIAIPIVAFAWFFPGFEFFMTYFFKVCSGGGTCQVAATLSVYLPVCLGIFAYSYRRAHDSGMILSIGIPVVVAVAFWSISPSRL